jgi:acyl-CoA reductase-like NAD-dependent aldehyde dehydrogenase
LENYGPVIIIESVDNDDEGVFRINNSRFGLIGGIYTTSDDKAQRLSAQINTGTVLINKTWTFDARCPLSGRKDSGKNIAFSYKTFSNFYRNKFIDHKFIL